MTQPTTLSPWFVVVRYDGPVPQYYRSIEVSTESQWCDDKRLAMLFMRLQSAAVVADEVKGTVQVLWTKEHIREYGR